MFMTRRAKIIVIRSTRRPVLCFSMPAFGAVAACPVESFLDKVSYLSPRFDQAVPGEMIKGTVNLNR